jgi:hypothetical protein
MSYIFLFFSIWGRILPREYAGLSSRYPVFISAAELFVFCQKNVLSFLKYLRPAFLEFLPVSVSSHFGDYPDASVGMLI